MTGQTLSPEEQAVVIAKVERLWRKARSTTFAAEAEAYEEKALYLMARARITDAMLDLNSSSDSIIDVKVGATLSGGYRIPAETIFSCVCKAFGCRGYLYVSGRRSQPAAVGFASDIDRVRFLWPFLHNDALIAAAQTQGSHGIPNLGPTEVGHVWLCRGDHRALRHDKPDRYRRFGLRS